MENSVHEDIDAIASLPEKRRPGRPRKHPVKDQLDVKKGRGRPRKTPVSDEPVVKRGRGRPRKYQIVEKERLSDGTFKPCFKKVESSHLLKHMLNYFTKLLIIHSKLANENKQFQMVFERLKQLDFQMAEVCRTVLEREYVTTMAENEKNKEAA